MSLSEGVNPKISNHCLCQYSPQTKQVVKNLTFALAIIVFIGSIVFGSLGMAHVSVFGTIGNLASQVMVYGGIGGCVLAVVAKAIDFYGSRKASNPKFPRIVEDSSHSVGRSEKVKEVKKIEKKFPIPAKPSGLVKVDGDGSCLFAAIVVHSKVVLGETSYTKSEVLQERFDTLLWIRDNLKTDTVLQQNLLESLMGLWESELGKLRDTQSSYKGFVQQEKWEYVEKLDTITDKISKMEKEETLIGRMYIKSLDKPLEASDLKLVMPYIEAYLKDMENYSSFGGRAELYALGQRHKRCLIVHSSIEKKYNEEFDSESPWHLHLAAVHYSPYFPNT